MILQKNYIRKYSKTDITRTDKLITQTLKKRYFKQSQTDITNTQTYSTNRQTDITKRQLDITNTDKLILRKVILFNLVLSISYSLYKLPSVTT